MIFNKKISSIQIQTINTCNSKCIMCPYEETFSRMEKMSDHLFIKIVDDIKEGISADLISGGLFLSPFFQNEPFLDKTIFDKIEYIREKIPNAFIRIFSNGLMLDKHIDKILKMKIDSFILSLYGYDVETFNYTTRLNINNKQYNNIIRAYNHLLEKANFKVEEGGAWIDGRMRGFSSRGGFFTNNKVIHKEVRGCKWNRDSWLNILSDGVIPICCMDWRREVIIGDVSKKSISEIILSKNRKNIVEKINGHKSEENFICKRCEKAVGDSEERLLDFNK